MATCPKCGTAREAGAVDCPQCGVIYAKVVAAEAKRQPGEQDRQDKTTQAPEQTQTLGAAATPNLTTCPSCQREISKNAKTCPHCGDPFAQPGLGSGQTVAEKNRTETKIPLGCTIPGLVIVAFAILVFIILPAHFKKLEKKSEDILSPAEEAQQEIDKCFGGWDGAHIKLKEAVKASMNDPDSFKAGETRYIDKIDHLIVIMDFSGKNAFGGIVKNSITAKTDKHNCEVLEIIEAPH